MRIGGWDEETERGRDTKSSLGGQETNKNQKKKKSKDFNLTAPSTLTHAYTSGKLLFPFVLKEEKNTAAVNVLVPIRLGYNLPTDGWSLPKKDNRSPQIHQHAPRRMFDHKCIRECVQ